MIYTITLNPALDYIIETNGFNLGETNYYQKDYSVVGGKGINVSIILNNLEADVISTGILGKENKDIFISKFNEIKLEHNFIINKGVTRTNFKVKNLQIKQETELNGIGSTIAKEVLNDLINYLKDNLKANDILVAAGSLPLGVENDIYQKLGDIANDKKATFILDTSKENMINGLKSKPFLIKPNIEEICEILKIEYKEYNLDEIKNMINQLQKLGARNILFSMGGKGSYYFDENKDIYKIGIANGKLVNSVGSGDSMIGGFTYALFKKMPITEALKYGSAAGGATAFTEWLGTKEDIEKLKNTIEVIKL